MGRSVDEPAAIFSRLAQRHWVLYLDRRAQPPTAAGPAITRLDIGLPPGGGPSWTNRRPSDASRASRGGIASSFGRPPGAGVSLPALQMRGRSSHTCFIRNSWPYVEDLDADYLVYHAYDLYERNGGWNPRLELFSETLMSGS